MVTPDLLQSRALEYVREISFTMVQGLDLVTAHPRHAGNLICKSQTPQTRGSKLKL